MNNKKKITTIIVSFIAFLATLTSIIYNIVTTHEILNKKNNDTIDTVFVKPVNEALNRAIIPNIPNQKDFKTIQKTIRGKVIDNDGLGLENVNITCKDCILDKPILTDIHGNFSLPIKHTIKDEENDQIEILFSYKGQEDKRSIHYTANNIEEPPKFKR